MGSESVRDSAERDVEAMLDELHALPPSGFVPRREEPAAARTVRRAGDTRLLHAARRPTLAAWAANPLPCSRPEEAQQFLEPGRALREAYATPEPDGLKELSAQRRRIVSEPTRQAAGPAREAGHPRSDVVQRDVQSTLRAVLADPDAADRWAAGRLEGALAPPSAFPAGASAPPAPAPTAPRPSAGGTSQAPARKKDEPAERRAERLKRLAGARAAAEAAGERLRDRRAEQADAEASLERAREHRREAGPWVPAAEERLRRAHEERERADREQRETEERGRTGADAPARAEREAKEAARAVRRAEERVRRPAAGARERGAAGPFRRPVAGARSVVDTMPRHVHVSGRRTL
ncbi:hypothetical protein [Streptomyces sp. NPDC007904]|jgi:hypothetical protein|uniref:hypothetical protein n=1 Tax=Streptomyces sp. NPDC007904 TaxID=3364787 RepID=UPI0036E011A6